MKKMICMIMVVCVAMFAFAGCGSDNRGTSKSRHTEISILRDFRSLEKGGK